LFGAHRIKSFARNANYLAVVLARADETDELRVIDLGTQEARAVNIPSNVQVNNLKFSPTDNQLIFVTRTPPGAEASESDVKAYNNRLYRYDVNAEQLQPVDASSDQGNVDSASYSPDGQALLYQTLDGEYYLTGATQTTEPSLLGKYLSSGGFDRTNTKLAVQPIAGDVAVQPTASDAIYDAQTKELRGLPDIRLGGQITTPMFLHNSDGLIYLKEPLGAENGGTLQVCTVDADGNVEEQETDLQSSAKFFDEPAVSYDDRYVLIEATFESQGDDDYVGNPKPKNARLVLYDRHDRKVVDPGTIRGVDPVWNP
jgi:WD40 repeat protein